MPTYQPPPYEEQLKIAREQKAQASAPNFYRGKEHAPPKMTRSDIRTKVTDKNVRSLFDAIP